MIGFLSRTIDTYLTPVTHKPQFRNRV